MKGRDFAANAACVRGIEIAFPPSSFLIFIPAIAVGTIKRCKYLTARASRVCRSVFSSGHPVWDLERQTLRRCREIDCDTSYALDEAAQ